MGSTLRTLIVEDSVDDTLLLVAELKRAGFEVAFEQVDRYEGMADALARQSWDIIFADYTMPHFRGTEALELVRKCGLDVPFIFVSGTIGEDTAVNAMKAGANDYILKGNLRRLVPAVQRELREAEMRRQRKQAQEAARRQQERLRALREIELAIASTLELRGVLELLLDKIDSLAPRPLAVTVRLFNKESGNLELAACRNLDEQEWSAGVWSREPDLDRMALESRAPLAVDDLQADPRAVGPEFFRKHGLIAYLGIPLIAGAEPLGVLSFYSRAEHGLGSEDREFLTTVAGQAAVAIHKAQLHEQTRQQMEELERANRVKSEFLSVMSHELKTPLNVVIGYAGMIRDKLLADQEKALEKILKQSGELLGMIDGILDVTAIEAGAITLRPEEFKLEHFLEELKAHYDYALGKELILLWEWPTGLPSMVSDSTKLKHILQNLINNAIKFTDRGRVTVSAAVVSPAPVLPSSVAGGAGGRGAGIRGQCRPPIPDRRPPVCGVQGRGYRTRYSAGQDSPNFRTIQAIGQYDEEIAWWSGHRASHRQDLHGDARWMG